MTCQTLMNTLNRRGFGLGLAALLVTGVGTGPTLAEEPLTTAIPGKVAFLEGTATAAETFVRTAFLPGGKYPATIDRIYQELDTIGPSGPGKKLCILDAPNDPACQPRVLADAGTGFIGGAMCCSFDGQTIFFSMAAEGDYYYRIYRVPVAGGKPVAITAGAFHDFDPELLPDGRIIFASTRIGSREEYHCYETSALFSMDPDGTNIRQVTFNIAWDREPKVAADGSVVFVRQDLMYDAAKIETQIFRVRPDGSGGHVLMGPDKGAGTYKRPGMDEEAPPSIGLIPGGRFGFKRGDVAYGCPAPLADGRVASLAAPWVPGGVKYPFDPGTYGVALSGEGGGGRPLKPLLSLADLSSLPDNRVLCSARDRSWLGVMDVGSGQVTPFYRPEKAQVQAATYVGPRAKPRTMAETVHGADTPEATGVFYCQNVRITRQDKADWKRIKAIRVIHGKPLAMRPGTASWGMWGTSHTGAEGHFLGSVPINPDGSFAVEVPANRSVSFLAVDAEGRAVINDLTWSQIRPGAVQSCVGCHSPRTTAPVATKAGSSGIHPVKLEIADFTYRYRTSSGCVSKGLLSDQFDRVKEAGALNSHAMPPPVTFSDADLKAAGGKSSTVRWLCDAFPNASSANKKAILERLRALHSRAAVPTIAAALADPDPEVRMVAGIAAAACGNRETVKPLLAAVGDSFPPARYAAHLALEHLTGDRGFAPEVLEDAGKLKARWNEWFNQTNWDAIEAATIEQLKAADPELSIMAAQRLGHVGGDPARAALRAFFQKQAGDDKSDLLSVVEAAKALGYLHDGESLDALNSVLNRCLEDIAKLRPYFQTRSKEHFASKPNALSKALARYGLPEVPEIVQEDHRLKSWALLDCEIRAMKLAAGCVEAIGLAGGQQASAMLVAALSKAQNHDVYNDIVEAQGINRNYAEMSTLYFRLAEALDEMATVLPEDAAFKLLLSIPWRVDRGIYFERDSYETMVARIVRRSGQTARILDTCFHLLGLSEAKPDRAFLECFLRTTHGVSLAYMYEDKPESFHEPFRAAQFAWTLAADPKDAPRFQAVYERHRAAFDGNRNIPKGISNEKRYAGHVHPWACFFALSALGDLKTEGAAEFFRSVLATEPTEAEVGMTPPIATVTFTGFTPFYRAAAARGLACVGDRKSVPLLLGIVKDFRNALDVRNTAARALQELCGPENVAELKPVAENYPETTTRMELLVALGKAQAGAKLSSAR